MVLHSESSFSTSQHCTTAPERVFTLSARSDTSLISVLQLLLCSFLRPLSALLLSLLTTIKFFLVFLMLSSVFSHVFSFPLFRPSYIFQFEGVVSWYLLLVDICLLFILIGSRNSDHKHPLNMWVLDLDMYCHGVLGIFFGSSKSMYFRFADYCFYCLAGMSIDLFIPFFPWKNTIL